MGRAIRTNGKSVKRCLKKVTGQAKFSYDELNTAVIEIEAIIIAPSDSIIFGGYRGAADSFPSHGREKTVKSIRQCGLHRAG